jgi:hypothetical protein
MSRRKKSRSLKDRLGVKTGSKQSFIGQGEKGKIPSKNRLAKHKNRSKSAYAKFLEENQGKDTSAGQGPKKIPDKADNRGESQIEYQHIPDTEAELDDVNFDELSGEELLDRFDRG